MAEEYFNIFKHIQKISLAAVESPNEDYVLRKIARIFSKTFHISIVDAEKLDLSYMLQHIYENQFEEMETNDKAKVATRLLDTSKIAEEDSEELRQAKEDDEWLAQLEQELKDEITKDGEKAKPKEPEISVDKLPDDVTIDFD